MASSTESFGLADWVQIEPLFDKAIQFPTEITEEEKHQIVDWIPSRKEMEDRTQKYLGRSLEDLFHTAATDRDSLTYPEFLMIHQGFHLLGGLDDVGRGIEKRRREKKHPELKAKWE